MAADRKCLTRWDGQDVEELARQWGVPHLEAYSSLGSTNDRARALAEAGCASWTTVVADVQTRGKGRRGSSWRSDAGAGLLLSTVVRQAGASGPLTLRIGLACAEAVEAVAPTLTVGLKWPNDLIVDGRKVGGILCEVGGEAVVVGIGLNVSGAPRPHALDRPAALAPAALEVMAGKILQRYALAGAIVAAARRLLEGDGVGDRPGGASANPDELHLSPEALAAVRRRDVLAGRLVETEQEGEGRAAGIDATGALCLVLSDGRDVRILSGSVRLSSSDDATSPVPEGA